MALTATLHTVRIGLNDSDRGVYEELELRVARHPSETAPYLITRLLAYCLFWETDIAFSKGLAAADEPAVWVRTLDGRTKLWIDIGKPSADRLHKASKASERVVVCTSHSPEALQRTLAGERIHRAQDIELVGMPPKLVEALEGQLDRRMSWDVAMTGGQLYVTSNGQTFEGTLTRQPLVAA
jgi:uncharacterized protein YaeQ